MVMSGGILIGGCAGVAVSYNQIIIFAVGNIVYDCRAANIGIMNKVCIKKVRVANDLGVIMYTDTFNRQWNEIDLCSLDDARAAALAYWNNKLLLVRNTVMSCGR